MGQDFLKPYLVPGPAGLGSMIMTDKKYLTLHQQDDITIVRFTNPTILDAYHINDVSKELYALVEQEGCRQIVLDFADIRMLSSQTLSVLLNMRKILDEVAGKMVISGIDPKLYRVFKITNVNSLFEFFDEVEVAVKSLEN